MQRIASIWANEGNAQHSSQKTMTCHSRHPVDLKNEIDCNWTDSIPLRFRTVQIEWYTGTAIDDQVR